MDLSTIKDLLLYPIETPMRLELCYRGEKDLSWQKLKVSEDVEQTGRSAYHLVLEDFLRVREFSKLSKYEDRSTIEALSFLLETMRRSPQVSLLFSPSGLEGAPLKVSSVSWLYYHPEGRLAAQLSSKLNLVKEELHYSFQPSNGDLNTSRIQASSAILSSMTSVGPYHGWDEKTKTLYFHNLEIHLRHQLHAETSHRGYRRSLSQDLLMDQIAIPISGHETAYKEIQKLWPNYSPKMISLSSAKPILRIFGENQFQLGVELSWQEKDLFVWNFPPNLLSSLLGLRFGEEADRAELEGLASQISNPVVTHLCLDGEPCKVEGLHLFAYQLALSLSRLEFDVSLLGGQKYRDFFVTGQRESKDPRIHTYTTTGSLLRVLRNPMLEGFKLVWNDRPIKILRSDELRINLDIHPEAQAISSHRSASSKLDWFEISSKLEISGQAFDLNELSSLLKSMMLEKDGELYVLQGSEGRSPFALAVAQELAQNPRHHVLDLLAWKSLGVPISGPPQWHQICEEFDRLSQPQPREALPQEIDKFLRPFQRVGVQWLLDLRKLGLGGVLADDMGLGKTVQTLAYLETLRQRGDLGPTLIVVPTTLVYNWIKETERFTPQLPIMAWSGGGTVLGEFVEASKGACLVVTTYGYLVTQMEELERIKWQQIIFDEAQYLKNETSRRAQGARRLEATYKYALTGTPLENHLGELHNIMDLVVPGSLGSRQSFKKSVSPTKPEDMARVRAKIRPLVLRRRKSETLQDLPEKQETSVFLDFSEKQRHLYTQVALLGQKEVQESILKRGEERSQVTMLSALMRLRQICSDPSGVFGSHYEEVPPKVQRIISQVEELVQEGHSAIVYTQFLSTFNRVESLLKRKGIPVFSIQGKTSSQQRVEQLEEFGGFEGGAVFLLTLRTGGIGLNLTKATYVFHLEPWWNPAVENQATDRVHRIGQTKFVHVYKYLMKNSLEEKMELLKLRKSEIFSSIFDSTDERLDEKLGREEAATSFLRQSDFEFLLGLRE